MKPHLDLCSQIQLLVVFGSLRVKLPKRLGRDLKVRRDITQTCQCNRQ